MSLKRLSAIAALLLASATHAHAQAPALGATSVKVTESGKTRGVDCRGEDLVLEGDNDRLDVRNCRAIAIVGDRNRLHVKFLVDTYITASGSKNNVVYTPYPGVEAIVRSTGAANEINPAPMAVDAKNNTPFKKPATSN